MRPLRFGIDFDGVIVDHRPHKLFLVAFKLKRFTSAWMGVRHLNHHSEDASLHARRQCAEWQARDRHRAKEHETITWIEHVTMGRTKNHFLGQL